MQPSPCPCRTATSKRPKPRACSDCKARVVAHARDTNNRAAARLFGFSEATVSAWRGHLDYVAAMAKYAARTAHG